MNPRTLQELFDAKQERRRWLAQLSIDEKIDLIEELQRGGRALIEARGTLPQPSSGGAKPLETPTP